MSNDVQLGFNIFFIVFLCYMLDKSFGLGHYILKGVDVASMISDWLAEIEKIDGINANIIYLLNNFISEIGIDSTTTVKPVEVKDQGLWIFDLFGVIIVDLVVLEIELIFIFVGVCEIKRGANLMGLVEHLNEVVVSLVERDLLEKRFMSIKVILHCVI